ncbi:CHAT domain-containing protein [Crepidotus variabilis]|uniref:CHAT domain-containing protein n=1 Tax=Crepidotus variabilis TaxID=179855 RepID=A0A9P6EIN8_9AGAR|nr:CHAT domain-containing protein [Crepidotus variabilis]
MALSTHLHDSKDFKIHCSLSESTSAAFKGLRLLAGLSKEPLEVIPTKRLSSTSWHCDYKTTLNSNHIDPALKFVVQSDTAGDLGQLSLEKDSLCIASFLPGDHDTRLQFNFANNEASSSLQLAFSISSTDLMPKCMNTVVNLLDQFDEDTFSNFLSLITTAQHFDDIGQFFRECYMETDREEDISRAISAFERAKFSSQERPEYPDYSLKLVDALQKRFILCGQVEDLNRSVLILEERFPCVVDDVVLLSEFGEVLFARFRVTGSLVDLDRAISHYQAAVQLTPEANNILAGRLYHLANALSERFGRTGTLADLDNAILHLQRAVQVTRDGHNMSSIWLVNLGIFLARRFRATGNAVDLEEAISSQQEGIQRSPDINPMLPNWLTNLGNSFMHRYEHTGELVDLENAISQQQKAFQLTPDSHALESLGVSFMRRFVRTGDIADIENAINHHQRALQLVDDRREGLPALLNSLGVCLMHNFRIKKKLSDLQDAISNQRKAIELTPEDHPHLPTFLNNLGFSLGRLFDHTGNLETLKEALSYQQKAVTTTPAGSTELPTRLLNLGDSFIQQYKRTRDITDIQNAILNQIRAVDLTPESHARLPVVFKHLGISYQNEFDHTRNRSSILQAISSYQKSATGRVGHPGIRLSSARIWAQLCRIHDPFQSLNAFQVAIRLLSEVVGLEQTIQKRYTHITNVSNIVTSATAAAIADHKLGLGLTWLEQGRCLVWNQINQLRTPIDDLQAVDSRLADRFLHIAHALEEFGSRQTELSIAEMVDGQTINQRHTGLARDWTTLLEEIRAIPDLRDFLQPPEAGALIAALPPDYHIIIFNIDKQRCDALALLPSTREPVHIPLEHFSFEIAAKMLEQLHGYLHGHSLLTREADRGVRWSQPQTSNYASFIHILLEQLWACIVKPVLAALDFSVPSLPQDRKRVWWIPTGPLALLPVHAAGIYQGANSPPGSCVSDFVVSSYVPTVRSLLDKVKCPSPKTSSLLLVSQPATPRLPEIPEARRETRLLDKMANTHGIKAVLLEDHSATTTRVKEELNRHSWVHFACHAVQNPRDPLKSGVHLHDDRLDLLDIIRQRFSNTDHVFLSACQTSTGDINLADEAVHIAAGMLAAGYRGVVATMWSIKDQHAPEIAEGFYVGLLQDSLKGGKGAKLDGSRAAQALDDSLRKIRGALGDTESALLTWVPYVHFGI